MESHKTNNTKEDFYISNEENEDNTFKINNSKYVEINSDLHHKRRLTSSEIIETYDANTKKEPRSRNCSECSRGRKCWPKVGSGPREETNR